MISISVHDEDQKISSALKEGLEEEAKKVLKKYGVLGDLKIHIKTHHNKNLVIIKSHLTADHLSINTDDEAYSLKEAFDAFLLSLEKQLMKNQEL